MMVVRTCGIACRALPIESSRETALSLCFDEVSRRGPGNRSPEKLSGMMAEDMPLERTPLRPPTHATYLEQNDSDRIVNLLQVFVFA
jgi:hypothetical protein